MTVTRKQSLAWRIFALTILILVGLTSLPDAIASLVARPDPLVILVHAANWAAIVGLVGFAFGRRVGPILFWRIFALPFAFYMMAATGPRIAALAAAAAGRSVDGFAYLASQAVTVPIVFLICLALLRHANLVGNSDAHDAAALRKLFA